MIELTRLGQRQPFLLNPDLIERIETHVDTVVRLTNGVEYVVVETGDEIVERIVSFRARVIQLGPVIARQAPGSTAGRRSARPPRLVGASDGSEEPTEATIVELPSAGSALAPDDPSRSPAVSADAPSSTSSNEVPR